MSGDLTVVGEGGNGAEAVQRAGELQPALMLLDVSMPVMDGLEALPQVLEASPDTRVVLYSGFEEQGLLEKARGLGASAFLKKSAPIEQLVGDACCLVGDRRRRPSTPPPPAPAHRVPEDQHVLDEHSERFREVFEAAAIGMATMTLSGNIVRANPALGELLHRQRARPRRRVLRRPHRRPRRPRASGLLEEIRTTRSAGELGPHRARGPRTVPARAGARHVRPGARLRRTAAVRVPPGPGRHRRAGGARGAARRASSGSAWSSTPSRTTRSSCSTPRGTSRAGTPGRERAKGYTADEIIGRHFRVFYPPEVAERGHPEHELELRPAGRPLRRGGLADPQGRHALLGVRRHHGGPGRRRAPRRASSRSPAT